MTNKHGHNWIWPARRHAIYARDGHACVYCGKGRSDPDVAYLTIDHLVAHDAGGSNASANLVTACDRCNSRRQHKTLRAWLADLRERGVDVEAARRRIRRARRRKVDLALGRRLFAEQRRCRATCDESSVGFLATQLASLVLGPPGLLSPLAPPEKPYVMPTCVVTGAPTSICDCGDHLVSE
jgi:hypothetical protein